MSQQQQGNATREQELGALWQMEGARGTYFTGSISLDGGATKTRVVIFKNTRKSSDGQPDFRILKSQPQQGDAPQRRPDNHPTNDPGYDPAPVTDDDIPF